MHNPQGTIPNKGKGVSKYFQIQRVLKSRRMVGRLLPCLPHGEDQGLPPHHLVPLHAPCGGARAWLDHLPADTIHDWVDL
jgi:hypothetical protein